MMSLQILQPKKSLIHIFRIQKLKNFKSIIAKKKYKDYITFINCQYKYSMKIASQCNYLFQICKIKIKINFVERDFLYIFSFFPINKKMQQNDLSNVPTTSRLLPKNTGDVEQYVYQTFYPKSCRLTELKKKKLYYSINTFFT